jgi:hypothetical protein
LLMNLNDLIAAGAFVRPGLVKKSVEWKYRNDDGEVVTCNFDVHVKQDQSAADFEFIYARELDDDVRMAKRVHRLVTLGETGEEKIPYDAALTMKPELLIVLCRAINEVEQPGSVNDKKPEGEAEKK